MKLKNIYKGFTLIELVMVIVILGIVSVVGFIAISSYQTQHLYAAAERIAGDLRYAKNLALTSTKWHGVAFDAGNNTYRLYETDGEIDTAIKSPINPSTDYVVDLSDDYKGVTMSDVDIDDGIQVEFSPLGVPYTDKKTGNAILSVGIITLSDDVTIRIAVETGRVSIQ